MSFIPYITGSDIKDFDRDELFNITNTLELEYRGGHISLDTTNIGKLIKGFRKIKLARFAIHTNIVGPIMDKENTTYINPPTRTFLTKNGGQISKKLQEYITDLYEQMNFDLFMAKAEKYTSLLGTTLLKPTFDEEDDTMNLIELYPSNSSLELKGNLKFPGKVAQVVYKYKVGKIEYTIIVDKDTTKTMWTENSVKHSNIDEHKFEMLPFAALKFKVDNSRVYGPPDYELYSLCKHRSLVLANSMARLHLSDYEKLYASGVDMDILLANMKEGIAAIPMQDDGAGGKVLPTLQYISPEGKEALHLLESYFKLYDHIMDNRGHVQKIFSRGADVPSAESIRLGSVDLFNKQQEKKKFLSVYEQELWKRIVKENNRYADTQIPEDTQLIVDYRPDPYSFANASDEVTYFQAAKADNVETPISWIKNRKPELTYEEARQLHKENIKINREIKAEAAENNEEIPSLNEEQPPPEQIVAEDAGEGNNE